MSKPAAKPSQEQFELQLEEYFDSTEGKDFLFGLISDYLKTEEGVSSIRAILSQDDKSGTTITTAATAAASTPAPALKKPKIARTVDSLPEKWDSLLESAANNWPFDHIATVRGKSKTRIINKTAVHIEDELDKWVDRALKLLIQTKFASPEEEHYVRTKLLRTLIHRMRCSFRFEAGIVILNALNKKHVPMLLETRHQVLQLLSDLRGRANMPIPGDSDPVSPKSADA